MRLFTNRPICDKCGYDRFRWEWDRGGLRSVDPPVIAHTLGDTDDREYLLLRCEQCGWRFVMQPKDASND